MEVKSPLTMIDRMLPELNLPFFGSHWPLVLIYQGHNMRVLINETVAAVIKPQTKKDE